ncbi:lipopolysaccharide biosynthesis protein [Motilibacter aurantiacus]|uniref:lipopolysaccharide biosynthesis protein n=1 Tax=Motilibacter aurantiacus TaxID=2714955 RepID=UPI00140D22A0|nr:lipopolysaccharide biosynthesis protein [Motilibacter aurantiacus]NHC47025.1 lipopolysaccharide biosynthesis protein [Motilibacter aurantiacus]
MTVSQREVPAGAASVPAPRRGPVRAARRLLSDGLVRGSFLLVLNQLLGAAAGFCFTLIAARLYPPAQLGVSTSALSATALAVNVAGLGLGYSVVRMLPTARDRAAMLDTCLTASGMALVAVPLVLALSPLTAELRAEGGAAVVPALLLGTLASGLLSVVEAVFVADRASGRVVAVTCVSSAVRLGALVAFLPLGALAAYCAQTAAWLIGASLLVLTLCRRDGYRPRLRMDRGALDALWRFSAGAYASAMTGSIPGMVVPLLVVGTLGTAEASFWYVAYQVANLLFLLGNMVSRSMLAEGSYAEAGRLALLRKGSLLLAAVLLPVLGVAYAGAPLLLSLFGSSYDAGASTLLRYLIVSAALVGANYVFGTVLLLDRRVFFSVFVNLANAALVIGLVLTSADSLAEVGRAWLAGEVLNVVLFGLGAAWVLRRRRAEWGPA